MTPARNRIRVLPGRRKMVPPFRKGVHLLPNLCTTGGLFCGFYAIIATLKEEYLVAAIAVLIALVFDVLDGRIARMTNTSSHFGVEYDSLSDLIAFGVAPGVLAYRWALEPWGAWGWLAAALYVTCGALRLARFNVQVEVADKKSFVGLPIPAAASVMATTILMYYYLGGEGATNKHLILLLLVYTLAGLMVSSIRYYSFKEMHLRHRQPFWILIAGIILIQLIIAEPQIMLFSIASLFALSGPARTLMEFARQGKSETAASEPLSEPQARTLDSDQGSSV
ncbi:MAG: CDP-diacylglycerol--serine O-phosphatidyltransferase [Candidatus Binatia bacterium]